MYINLIGGKHINQKASHLLLRQFNIGLKEGFVIGIKVYGVVGI